MGCEQTHPWCKLFFSWLICESEWVLLRYSHFFLADLWIISEHLHGATFFFFTNLQVVDLESWANVSQQFQPLTLVQYYTKTLKIIKIKHKSRSILWLLVVTNQKTRKSNIIHRWKHKERGEENTISIFFGTIDGWFLKGSNKDYIIDREKTQWVNKQERKST